MTILYIFYFGKGAHLAPRARRRLAAVLEGAVSNVGMNARARRQNSGGGGGGGAACIRSSLLKNARARRQKRRKERKPLAAKLKRAFRTRAAPPAAALH